MTQRRFCYIVLETQKDEHGYIPSVVFEGESGHRPMTGDPEKHQLPWYWGTHWPTAVKTCEAQNARLGLTQADVDAIVLSSMQAD